MWDESDKPHEECAVFGVSIRHAGCAAEAAGIAYNALLAMQHRGQEGAGIAISSDNSIYCMKNTGLVSEVFTENGLDSLTKLKSYTSVGHARYSTTGNSSYENVQPFVSEYLTGRIATVHNGNITNAEGLKQKLLQYGVSFRGTSDSEVISSLAAYYSIKTGDVRQGAIEAANETEGAFSLIILSGDGRMIVIRDACGYRPLCIGKNENGVAVASESCALDSCGFAFVRDVKPGEVIEIDDGKIVSQSVEIIEKESDKGNGICIFEYIYFARPDSVIENLSVYEARHNMGKILAKEFPVEADAVCGTPDSGIEAAIGYSTESGIPLVTGFVKNRYIGRSFIYPTQAQRQSAVRLKLNPLTSNIKGKRIVLVDDSIVRGTTSEKIVKSLKNAGAREVHMRISSPPFKYTCHYGTDIDDEGKLIANKMTFDEIRRKISADSLGYISIDGLKEACKKCNLSFCDRCFSGGRNNKIRKNALK